jgi:small subunit ribosomal protein S17
MTNEQLADPTTIPGFTTLIHSPPKDRSTTPRNALFGKVVSTKMQKTVNVEVNRFKIHPKYHKRMRYTRKFMAHDEDEVCHEGDWVVIAPCQKMSKKKHFRVHEIVRQKGVL